MDLSLWFQLLCGIAGPKQLNTASVKGRYGGLTSTGVKPVVDETRKPRHHNTNHAQPNHSCFHFFVFCSNVLRRLSKLCRQWSVYGQCANAEGRTPQRRAGVVHEPGWKGGACLAAPTQDRAISYHELQNRRYKWSLSQTLRCARKLNSDLCWNINRDTPHRWRTQVHRAESTGSRRGLHWILSAM